MTLFFRLPFAYHETTLNTCFYFVYISTIMPPKRKAPASSASNKGSKAAAKEKATNPYDEFFEAFDKVQKRNPKNKGAMVIKGISSGEDSDSDDEDDEEKEVDKSKYTAEQMSTLRYVFITQKREDKLNEMKEYVLGDQATHSVMMFNTSFSYDILDGFNHYKSSGWKKLKTPADKFDSLFAYTYMLKNYDVWLNDNEGGMEDITKGLASMWKRLLKNDDDKLDIDAEYTRPGIVQLLNDFKSDIEMQDLEFNFQ